MESIKKMLLGIVFLLAGIYLLVLYIGSNSSIGEIVIFASFALLPAGVVTAIVGFADTEDKEDE